jgi:hypothetical protein
MKEIASQIEMVGMDLDSFGGLGSLGHDPKPHPPPPPQQHVVE